MVVKGLCDGNNMEKMCSFFGWKGDSQDDDDTEENKIIFEKLIIYSQCPICCVYGYVFIFFVAIINHLLRMGKVFIVPSYPKYPIKLWWAG